jgi:hypothetical protein
MPNAFVTGAAGFIGRENSRERTQGTQRGQAKTKVTGEK